MIGSKGCWSILFCESLTFRPPPLRASVHFACQLPPLEQQLLKSPQESECESAKVRITVARRISSVVAVAVARRPRAANSSSWTARSPRRFTAATATTARSSSSFCRARVFRVARARALGRYHYWAPRYRTPFHTSRLALCNSNSTATARTHTYSLLALRTRLRLPPGDTAQWRSSSIKHRTRTPTRIRSRTPTPPPRMPSRRSATSRSARQSVCRRGATAIASTSTCTRTHIRTGNIYLRSNLLQLHAAHRARDGADSGRRNGGRGSCAHATGRWNARLPAARGGRPTRRPRARHELLRYALARQLHARTLSNMCTWSARAVVRADTTGRGKFFYYGY